MEIPLFPLHNLVLFPNVAVPLHIFENRYKLMINACIDNDEVFGLVLLRTGADEEREETMHRVGVTARVVNVERLDDGRLNILAEGESRFRIARLTEQMPYWKASVTLLEDAGSASSADPLYEEVSGLYRKVFELGTRLGISEESDVRLPDSPADLSYMVSYVLDIESEEKQKLLEMTTAGERLHVLVQHLTEAINKLEQRIALKAKIVKIHGNGDLGRPGGR